MCGIWESAADSPTPALPTPPSFPLQDLMGKAEISWNHTEFEVHYECLADEVRVGDYFLRLLLEEGNSTSTRFDNP